MELKAHLMDAEGMDRALKRIAHQILEKNEGCKDLVILGVKSRGVPLAKMLANHIESIEGVRVPVGILDITMHRDDLQERSDKAHINGTVVDFPIEGKTVVVVDDVIYTGRTARAALDAISSLGRAGRIQLACLIDRGHRELPIRPDYVGKNVPTSLNENVSVQVEEYDGKTCVELYSL